MSTREKIYNVITPLGRLHRGSIVYDSVMVGVIILSIIPLCFREMSVPLYVCDGVATGFFVVDYILREITADYHLKRGKSSFWRYPFTGQAILDFICLLPSLWILSASFRLVGTIRLFRLVHIFRCFKIFRYSRSLRLIWHVLQDEKRPLLAVVILALGYDFTAALLMWGVEPDMFETFFEALYWSTISLTSVGYGDIVPTTTVGRLVAMVSSFVGVGIIALPSGILTAGFMRHLDIRRKERKKAEAEEEQTREAGRDSIK